MNNKDDMLRRLSIALIIVLLILAGLYLAYIFADILRILGISILFSYLLINLVDWSNKFLKNRAMCIVIIYALMSVIFIVAFLTVVPSLVYQLNLLLSSTIKQVPGIFEHFIRSLAPLDERLAAAKIQIRAIDMVTKIAQSLPSIDSSAILGRMSEVALSTMTWAVYGLSVLVLTFYFLLDGHSMRERVIGALPVASHKLLNEMAGDIDVNLQAFFRGQIVLGFAFGLFMMGIYFLLGVQYALVLGIVLAIWEVVPVIGPLLGFIPALLIVTISGMDFVPIDRIWQVILLVAIFNVAQWLKDNTIAPRYIGNAVGLHPVVIFIAIMIGARMDGMLGIIFAIPAASVVNVVYKHLWANARSKNIMEELPKEAEQQ